ncbi:hypothetical protein NDU88_003895 [Pleurodeles waltl]|uniref:Secreted protein n=1 Tax=Pleurodeles waltl TaxID=8319 RepID=A0AAV7PFW7_PLEWA|nr:hypothetical protein NDU88_003895 [Pleurodeles waltl]
MAVGVLKWLSMLAVSTVVVIPFVFCRPVGALKIKLHRRVCIRKVSDASIAYSQVRPCIISFSSRVDDASFLSLTRERWVDFLVGHLVSVQSQVDFDAQERCVEDPVALFRKIPLRGVCVIISLRKQVLHVGSPAATRRSPSYDAGGALISTAKMAARR